ncbi:CARDB domain-containing protein, partial [Streptomyces sp. NPDC003038]|uniref:DUF6923 family protein n=1 Tax=unclassified Streptomyces TaxID=2593676 RepID=UPI0033A1370C
MWRTAAVSVVAFTTLGAPLAVQAQAAAGAIQAEDSRGVRGLKLQPGTPFECNGQILRSAGALPPAPIQLYEGTAGAGTVAFTPLGPPTEQYNAIAINPLDRFLYAMGPGNELKRIDSTGAVTDLGPVTGLPLPPNASPDSPSYFVGAFLPDGTYVVAGGAGSTTLYRINPATNTVVGTTELSGPLGTWDLTYSNGFLWGGDANGDLVRVDPATGQVTRFPNVLPVLTDSLYGGAFTYGNGDLGLIDNEGIIYRVDPTTRAVVSRQTAPPGLQADAASCFLAPVDLELTKTVAPATYVAGQQVTYTIRVRNAGPNPSSGFTVTDAIPAGLLNVASTTPGCTVTGQNLSCTSGPLAVNGTRDITITAVAGANATGTLTNEACVRGNDPDANAANNCDTTPVTPRRVDLSITKSATPARVTAGGQVEYTMVIRNNGPDASTGFTVRDALPAGITDASSPTAGCTVSGQTVTCTGGALAVGATRTVTIVGTAAEDAARTLTNRACVEGREPDTNEANNCATTTVIVPRSDLSITKSADPVRVSAGGQVEYTMVIRNNGPDASTGFTVRDALPAGITNASSPTAGCTVSGQTVTCTGGALAVGATRTVTIVGTAAEDAARTLTNRACVEGREPDTNEANNCATTTVIVPRSDLSITKSATPARVTAGGQVRYTMVIRNNGPDASTGYTLTDPFPAGIDVTDMSGMECFTVSPGLDDMTCTGGPLAVGATRTVTITGTVAEDAARTLTNRACVEGREPDTNEANNCATATVIVPRSDLSITKSATPARVTAGGQVRYTMVIRN